MGEILVNEKRWLFLYLSGVLFLGVVHNEFVMLLSIAFTFFLNKKAKFRILFKALFVILFFNATVTISYLVYSFFEASANPYALVLINLRALAITMLTFTLIHNINIHKALEFHPFSSILYSFTYAQIILLKSMLNDYYNGLKSRGASFKQQINKEQLPPLFATLFGTMLHKSNEQTMALKSRGLLDG